MTTYEHTVASTASHRTAHRLWALLAVLVLAGIATLIVLVTSTDNDHANPAAPSQIGTVQQPDNGHGARFDCRPTNVPHPC